MNDELLPCPFCGSSKWLQLLETAASDPDDPEFYVVCSAHEGFGHLGCGAQVGHGTRENAIRLWNTRKG